MEQEAVSVSSLVDVVHRRGSGSPLEQLDAARLLSEEVARASDELLGFFIDEARRAGDSWTAIGQHMGVSKQAARQRFGDAARLGTADGLPLMPRLRACLEAAAGEAAADGSPEIGTHHHLLGLCRDGVASATLEKLGLGDDHLRAAARRLFPASPPADVPPPDSLEATVAVERAARLAERGGGCVGTEHLLYSIAFDPGSRARRVLIRADADLAALKRELSCFLEVPKPRRRRRRTPDGARSCSFCGKGRLDHVRLVAGPEVWICDECVLLCTEILAEELARGSSA